jgi:hypothetical protein
MMNTNTEVEKKKQRYDFKKSEDVINSMLEVGRSMLDVQCNSAITVPGKVIELLKGDFFL